MKPENLTVNVRARSEAEALQTGIELCRANLPMLYKIWLLSFGIMSLVLLPLAIYAPILYMFLIWWLAPLFERFLLFYLSRKVFSVELTLKQVWQERKSFLSKGLMAQLLWRRLSPSRGFYLPLWILEDCKSGQLSRRSSQLQNGGATSFFFGFLTMEHLLSSALFSILLSFAPAGSSSIFEVSDFAFENGYINSLDYFLMTLSYPLGILLIRPFFVCANFGLYLNGRVLEEAWDLRLGFTALARRIGGTGAKLIIFGLIFLSGLFAVPQQGFAQQASSSVEQADSQNLEQEMKALLGEEQVFGRAPEIEESAKDFDQKGYDSTPTAVSGLFEVVLIILLIGIVVLIIYFIVKSINSNDRSMRELNDVPLKKNNFGGRSLNRREEILVDHLRLAEEAFKQGKLRECLSFLYQGNLEYLKHRFHVRIPHAATEGDCLRLAKPLLPAPALQQFEQLSRCWVSTAYAHMPPSGEEVSQQVRNFEQAYREQLRDEEKEQNKSLSKANKAAKRRK